MFPKVGTKIWTFSFCVQSRPMSLSLLVRNWSWLTVTYHPWPEWRSHVMSASFELGDWVGSYQDQSCPVTPLPILAFAKKKNKKTKTKQSKQNWSQFTKCMFIQESSCAHFMKISMSRAACKPRNCSWVHGPAYWQLYYSPNNMVVTWFVRFQN